MTKRHARIVGITLFCFFIFSLFFFFFGSSRCMQIQLAGRGQLVLLYLSFTSLNVHDPLAWDWGGEVAPKTEKQKQQTEEREKTKNEHTAVDIKFRSEFLLSSLKKAAESWWNLTKSSSRKGRKKGGERATHWFDRPRQRRNNKQTFARTADTLLS